MCELTSIADGRLRTTNATLAHANVGRQVRKLLKRAYVPADLPLCGKNCLRKNLRGQPTARAGLCLWRVLQAD